MIYMICNRMYNTVECVLYMKRGLHEGLFLTIFNSINFLLLVLYFTRVLDTYPNTGEVSNPQHCGDLLWGTYDAGAEGEGLDQLDLCGENAAVYLPFRLVLAQLVAEAAE